MVEDRSPWSLPDEQGLLSAVRQFARSLAASAQFAKLESAHRCLMTDVPGMKAVDEFHACQQRLGWLVQNGLASDGDRSELARLEQAMLTHETVKSYLDAETEIASLCQEAAALVSSLLGVSLAGGCSCGC